VSRTDHHFRYEKHHNANRRIASHRRDAIEFERVSNLGDAPELVYADFTPEPLAEWEAELLGLPKGTVWTEGPGSAPDNVWHDDPLDFEYERRETCGAIRASDRLDCVREPGHFGRHAHEHILWTDDACEEPESEPSIPMMTLTEFRAHTGYSDTGFSDGFSVTTEAPIQRESMRGPGIRVWELARALGIESSVLVNALRANGEYVTSHASWLAKPAAERIAQHFPSTFVWADLDPTTYPKEHSLSDTALNRLRQSLLASA
jgi:hypothetical protein